MAAQKIEMPVSIDARELQRRYAATVYCLRGRLSEAHGFERPAQNNFKLSRGSVTDFGERVEINGTFKTPPLLAYLDGNQPLDLHIAYHVNESVAVAVSIPSYTTATVGLVSLVWPDKTISSEEVLRRRPSSKILPFDLDQTSLPPNEWLVIPWFREPPREVHIGMTEIDPDDWAWDGSKLTIGIQKDLTPGPVLIITDNSVARSSQLFALAEEE